MASPYPRAFSRTRSATTLTTKVPIARNEHGSLCLGGVDTARLASIVGTPAYVYDLDGIGGELRALRDAFEGSAHLVAYAVKANTAGAIVRELAHESCGADVVSGAELLVALACGIPAERIVYSGVAKLDHELDQAIGAGIGAVQIESIEEIARVAGRARALTRRARVSVRVNPGVDLEGATHTHVATGHDAAKFGVRKEDVASAVDLIEKSPELELVGMATHVGSQLGSIEPYLQSARVLFGLVRSLRDATRLGSISFVDTGGGFGLPYDESGEKWPRPADFVRAARIEQRANRLDDLSLYIEPGRAVVAPHGILLASVVQPKVTAVARWLMIDAGMNDLLRPALYQATHRIVPLQAATDPGEWIPWRVAGPVCESSDDFGEHMLPREPPRAVAILDVGAYGYTMASRYNGRQAPVEVFLKDGRVIGQTTRLRVESWVEERVAAGKK
jgi:diaminopimelate decarboxylase